MCKDGPRRSCARIILLKVSDQPDPLTETLTYAVLDDQSTDVFITDALQSKLNLSGAEVNLQETLCGHQRRQNAESPRPSNPSYKRRIFTR